MAEEKKLDWTADRIRDRMMTSDLSLYRCILHIYNMQTELEQADEFTSELNGVGFNKIDAEIMTSFAKQLQERNPMWLSKGQKEVARKRMPKYAKQVERILASRAKKD